MPPPPIFVFFIDGGRMLERIRERMVLLFLLAQRRLSTPLPTSVPHSGTWCTQNPDGNGLKHLLGFRVRCRTLLSRPQQTV